jgi:hypothetical protein
MMGPIGRVAIACLAVALMAVATAHGQIRSADGGQQNPQRAPDGVPDIQGVWATAFLTPLERPEAVTRLVVGPQQARSMVDAIRSSFPSVIEPDVSFHDIRSLAVVGGERRTSLIVSPADGRLPFTQAALEQVRMADESFYNDFDGPEQRPLTERCLAGLGRAPMRAVPVFLPRRIIQTPDHVVIMSEDVAGLRVIHLTDEPPPAALRSREGYSRGRWDGDTLVIETTHLRADDPVRAHLGRAIVVGPDSVIVESLKRVSNDELLYQFTVQDDALYSRPWLAEYSMKSTSLPTYEYACHEANYSMKGILLGGRALDQRKLQSAGNK